jgi:glutamyl-tRNA synthetase
MDNNRNKLDKKIRVRFAPSPTGYLHIGGARTAIFNWLFARKMNGTFILRIEDTDEVRSTTESVDAIIKSLTWLGIDWDEGVEIVSGYNELIFESQNRDNTIPYKGEYGPYFQMERYKKGIYKKYIDKLLEEGKVYYCYCTPEEIEDLRQKQKISKNEVRLDDRCRDLNEEQRKELQNKIQNPVIRFKMPKEDKTIVNDVIRGKVEFENVLLDDFIIVKSSGGPTYNFACVIDDHLMGITHVIRGDDHLSNTPKQIQLYNALGWQPPQFAHLSMILGPDRTKLSKRHGYTSVLEYKTNGFLPEAIFNYLVLLGWSTEDSQQIFTKDEIIEKFSLERCAKNPAIFDQKKIIWMNGEYIRKMSIDNLYTKFLNWLSETGQRELLDKIKNKEELVKKVIKLEQDKIKLLSDIPKRIDFFLKNDLEYNDYDPEDIDKVLRKPNVDKILKEIVKIYQQINEFTATELEAKTRIYADTNGLKTSDIFHPIRVAVSGRTVGPGLFEMLELLGKETVIRRINFSLEKFC